MADTIQTTKVPLTAEERRQRRVQKILENSESRMNRILSNGGDENGKRHAPAMEGGECYSFPDDSSVVVENSFSTEFSRRSDTQHAHEEVSTKTPEKAKFFDVTLFAFVLGIGSRFLMLFTGPINVGILWMILYTTIVIRFSTAGLKPNVKSELNVLLGALSNDQFFKKIINAGFYCIEFVQTTITFVASFLLAHMLFEIYDLSTNYHVVF